MAKSKTQHPHRGFMLAGGALSVLAMVAFTLGLTLQPGAVGAYTLVGVALLVIAAVLFITAIVRLRPHAGQDPDASGQRPNPN